MVADYCNLVGGGGGSGSGSGHRNLRSIRSCMTRNWSWWNWFYPVFRMWKCIWMGMIKIVWDLFNNNGFFTKSYCRALDPDFNISFPILHKGV